MLWSLFFNSFFSTPSSCPRHRVFVSLTGLTQVCRIFLLSFCITFCSYLHREAQPSPVIFLIIITFLLHCLCKSAYVCRSKIKNSYLLAFASKQYIFFFSCFAPAFLSFSYFLLKAPVASRPCYWCSGWSSLFIFCAYICLVTSLSSFLYIVYLRFFF
jgi:hypothetical protein